MQASPKKKCKPRPKKMQASPKKYAVTNHGTVEGIRRYGQAAVQL
jgi:hypothetical protein